MTTFCSPIGKYKEPRPEDDSGTDGYNLKQSNAFLQAHQSLPANHVVLCCLQTLNKHVNPMSISPVGALQWAQDALPTNEQCRAHILVRFFDVGMKHRVRALGHESLCRSAGGRYSHSLISRLQGRWFSTVVSKLFST